MSKTGRVIYLRPGTTVDFRQPMCLQSGGELGFLCSLVEGHDSPHSWDDTVHDTPTNGGSVSE